MWIFSEKDSGGQLLDGAVQLFVGNGTIKIRLNFKTNSGYIELNADKIQESVWHSIAVTYDSR